MAYIFSTDGLIFFFFIFSRTNTSDSKGILVTTLGVFISSCTHPFVVFAYHIVDAVSLSFFRYWKLNSVAVFPVFFLSIFLLWSLQLVAGCLYCFCCRCRFVFIFISDLLAWGPLLVQLLCGLNLDLPLVKHLP